MSCQQTVNAASQASSQASTNTPTSSLAPFSFPRNMRVGSNSQAGKAVVDSSLDLAGLGYFYFPKSHRGGREEWWKEALKSFYKCQTTTGDREASEIHALCARTHESKEVKKKGSAASKEETHHSSSHQVVEATTWGQRREQVEEKREECRAGRRGCWVGDTQLFR